MTLIKPVARFQIGKNGISESSINAIRPLLEHYKQVRVSMLPSSGRTRGNINQMAQEIKDKLNVSCYVKVIGFTVVLLRKGAFTTR